MSDVPKSNQNKKNYGENEINRLLKNFRESSYTKQLSLGTITGWCTGTVVNKIGKTVAFTIGSGILLYEIAHHNGLIKPDWDKLKENAEKKTSDLDIKYVQQKQVAFNKITTFARKNKVFTIGFIGGFFLGISH